MPSEGGDGYDPYDDEDRPFWERDWKHMEEVLGGIGLSTMARELVKPLAFVFGSIGLFAGGYTAVVRGALDHPSKLVRLALIVFTVVHFGRAGTRRGTLTEKKRTETPEQTRARRNTPEELTPARIGWMSGWGAAVGLAASTWLSWPRAVLVALAAAGGNVGLFFFSEHVRPRMDRLGLLFGKKEGES